MTKQIADFAAGTAADRIDAEAMAVMRLSLLDWLSVGIAGRDEPVSAIVRDMVAEEAGAAQATVFGGVMVPVRAAALANGTIAHALDYDDTHFANIGHPSAPVVAAALAVAEKTGADGAAFQQACLIGVECSTRIGIWLGRDHYQGGFHQTGTAGTFGAAMAVARLMGLDAAQCEMVLGLAATRASGLKSQFGTMAKPYNAGLAASNGVEAATLVARGFVANPLGLEAAQGFGPTHMGQADMSALDGLGTTWVFPQVSHKFHACCHGLHAVLEAARTLDAVDPDRIAAIRVRTHPRWMTVCNQPEPMTGLGAKFSYATVLPMHFLGHDTGALDSYTDALCADAAIQRLRKLVEVTADDSVSETGAVLEVELSDGGKMQATHDLNAPMPLAEREAKVRAKSRSLIGEDRPEEAWAAICAEAPASSIASFLTS
ncbi:MmgE/PrpD family protein [Rhodobacteraceae bacterium GS-10]|uniref:MmgE/PrpD family protein n=1 Tax=Thalassovita mangrovi TaxID=2692236 RepID=A0A6L8LJJ8_9RHOB|nr:MmgE/PrpD family protein [Thalassovita mangrovi]